MIEETEHFRLMLIERVIKQEWVNDTLDNPDLIEDRTDGTKHYLKQIADNNKRWLRVIVAVNVSPNKKITAFFDRRIGRIYANKN